MHSNSKCYFAGPQTALKPCYVHSAFMTKI